MEGTAEMGSETLYEYEELCSRACVTPGAQISESLLRLRHSFGYDSGLRGNLQLLDDRTLIFIAGDLLVLLDISTREQRHLRSSGGGGIGAITVHLSRKYFAVAEKGNRPSITVYESPSLRRYRVLRDGTEKAYSSSVDFNKDGSLLASVGTAPDFMLTVWDWRQEQVTLRAKAISKEVFTVRFSPHNPERLTSSGFEHIMFWEMADTFTELKLQGRIGRFGATEPTDIEGFVELPDGTVVSGSSWGNLLLWEGSAIRMEISRKDGQSCHQGTVQPFALEDGHLMTCGSDGVIRVWDFDGIDIAIGGSKYELGPVKEMAVGQNVCLCSVVRSPQPDSTMWFAQDSRGAIWRVDLSFTNTSLDPERLFSFHAGAIQGLDVSETSHLMATTSPDCSVRVFDFLSSRELASIYFNQGGTVINWAPTSVDQSGGLLVTGFEDGVVRVLELYDPQKLDLDNPNPNRHKGGAELRLKQALKPHSGPVTAAAFKHDGVFLATGSLDAAVFFFSVGETYEPIGFVRVPGPVQALEWSPDPESEDKLLIMCKSGHVVEVQLVDLEAHFLADTFQLLRLPSRSFRFRSIKSQIKREEETARRQALKEAKENEVEDEEELPSIHIPDPPSPLCCGFYSQSDHFWLSMGGFDSGYLYHCKFSENQDQDPNQRQDEPFHFLPIHNADQDPILCATFSSDRQMLFCGMHSGAIRVYPLQPGDHGLASMQAHWTLSLHDNQHGHLHHVRRSYDDKFVLTAGNDGNIFSLSTVPPEEPQKGRLTATIPSPRVGLEGEKAAMDIEDPAANTIETEKQKKHEDQLNQDIRLRMETKRRAIAELRVKFEELLKQNEALPEHFRLTPSELQIDPCFSDQAEKLKVQKVMEVRKQMQWEQERCDVGLRKIQEYFRGTFGDRVVSVVAIHTNHKISTYCLSELAKAPTQPQRSHSGLHVDPTIAPPRKESRPQPEDVVSSTSEDEGMMLQLRAKKKENQQAERARKAGEKAEQARAAIEKRKKDWAQLYAEKPGDDCEDPKDVQAVQEAKENLGDLKLKSDKDFTVPKHLRMNAETMEARLRSLEEKIHQEQTRMNKRILALRDAKVCLVSQLLDQGEQLQKIQQGLAPHLHRPPPALPVMLPEETPEKKVQHSDDALERYRSLREQRAWTKGDLTMEEEEQITNREEEVLKDVELTLQDQQDSLLEQMESSICQFDAELQVLHLEKLELDCELKQAELRRLTVYQELLIHKEFKEREESLQEKLNQCNKEESFLKRRLEERNKDLELKQAEGARLQGKQKALLAAFQGLLGEDNEFEKFLTKVFEMKAEKVKKRKDTGDGERRNTREGGAGSAHSDEDYDSDLDEEGAAVDYKVCPPGCDPDLFQDTERLRQRRLQLEERLEKKEKDIKILERDENYLHTKENVMKTNLEAVEQDVDSTVREKQLKMNALDVVAPLRQQQIEFVADGPPPSDLAPALVLNREELRRLQERIERFEVEKNQQEVLLTQARKEHVKLFHDGKDKSAKIEELEKECNQLMMTKFGRLVDLEVLLTMKRSRTVEKLKQKKLLSEAEHLKNVHRWKCVSV
ncbi:cilia- and flagella-associated protein 44 [Brachionichthys hirsutus]|uniref:cilia- and flagella-associated protein 44 n=1 Tax=Brachionichthys hirsutus TaxID=412623 RepID=UPI003604ED88